MRMLEPKELYGCQGFPDDYIIDRDCDGKPYPRAEQVRRCGNAVCSADTYGTGAGESERVMRCEAAAEAAGRDVWARMRAGS